MIRILILIFAAALTSQVIAQNYPPRMYLKVSQMDTITIKIPEYDVTVKLKDRKGTFKKGSVTGTVTLDSRFQGEPLSKDLKDNDFIGILTVDTVISHPKADKSLPTRYLILFHALGYKFEQCDFFRIGFEFKVKDFWTERWAGGAMKNLELRGTNNYKVIVKLLTWREGASIDDTPTVEHEFKLTVSKHHFMEKQ
ncbi:MAG: hypothetical protein WCU00_08830 [Candidatus Latescibacterota bacterium]